jgi:hypothetical protein
MEQQQAAHPHRKPKAGPKAERKKAKHLAKQTNQPADAEAAKQRNPKVLHHPLSLPPTARLWRARVLLPHFYIYIYIYIGCSACFSTSVYSSIIGHLFLFNNNNSSSSSRVLLFLCTIVCAGLFVWVNTKRGKESAETCVRA